MLRQHRLRAWVESAVNIQQHEVPLVLNAFGAFFCVLASFFLLLPLREEAGVSLGTGTLPWLFMCSLLVTSIVAPVTSAFLSRSGVTRDVALRQLLQFFAATLIGMFLFYYWTLMFSQPGAQDPPEKPGALRRQLHEQTPSVSSAPDLQSIQLPTVDKARFGDIQLNCMQRNFRALFYCWINVMNLVAISTLWARCAEVFSTEAGARLFGVVSAGGTAGQLVGSVSAGMYSAMMPRDQAAVWLGFLMPISAAIMLGASVLISRLKPVGHPESSRSVAEPQKSRLCDLEPANKAGVTSGPLSRQVEALFEGFRLVAGSRYLCLMCAYVLVHTVIGSLLYFVRATIIATQLHATASRTSFFAAVNSAAASILIVLQLFATGNILSFMGVPLALFASPVAALLGLFSLLMHPYAATVGAVDVCRKIVQYTVTKPAREVLFTVVSRQEKYKAKLLIDTLVIRAGDALAAAAFQFLDSHLRLGGHNVVLLALVCCGVWLLLAHKLGTYYTNLALQSHAIVKPAAK